ncbi:MAG: winged helix-turn-helix transcriptional regulator [Methanomicrobiales archaeon]|nr:winged helix-turn-helix transcriptional regulator [Methanomicrobiales archaeon]
MPDVSYVITMRPGIPIAFLLALFLACIPVITAADCDTDTDEHAPILSHCADAMAQSAPGDDERDISSKRSNIDDSPIIDISAAFAIQKEQEADAVEDDPSGISESSSRSESDETYADGKVTRLTERDSDRNSRDMPLLSGASGDTRISDADDGESAGNHGTGGEEEWGISYDNRNRIHSLSGPEDDSEEYAVGIRERTRQSDPEDKHGTTWENDPIGIGIGGLSPVALSLLHNGKTSPEQDPRPAGTRLPGSDLSPRCPQVPVFPEKADKIRRKKYRTGTWLDSVMFMDDSTPDIPHPLDFTIFFKFWLGLGFRRIFRRNVLDHSERAAVYEQIASSPGIDVTSLADQKSMNRQTLRYHLGVLSMHGKIQFLIQSGVVRCFPNNGIFNEIEKKVIHYLWTETTRTILMALLHNPGLSRQDLVDHIGISGPSITWQMERLHKDEIVRIDAIGKQKSYRLTAVTEQLLCKKTAGLLV